MKSVPCTAAAIVLLATVASAQQRRLDLDPTMLTNETQFGDPSGLVDEQRDIIGPPAGTPAMMWQVDSRHNRDFPVSAHLDLKAERNLASLWIFDTHDTGEVVISSGAPGKWTPAATYDCGSYMKWVEIPLNTTSRYLRITRRTPGAQFTEIAVYEHTPEAHKEMLAKQAGDQRRAADELAAVAKAREEALQRPLVEMAPYGTLSLVDEIDCTAGTHHFRSAGAGVSSIERILGRNCLTLAKTPGEANAVTWRIGRSKLLRPGGTYVLALEYPESASRTSRSSGTSWRTSSGPARSA